MTPPIYRTPPGVYNNLEQRHDGYQDPDYIIACSNIPPIMSVPGVNDNGSQPYVTGPIGFGGVNIQRSPNYQAEEKRLFKIFWVESRKRPYGGRVEGMTSRLRTIIVTGPTSFHVAIMSLVGDGAPSMLQRLT